MSQDTTLLVIGAGPGGYAAAFMAADLGLKVTLIGEDKDPGGVCLYRGCIPSKALLHAAKLISDSREAADMGISFRGANIDLVKMREWKNDIVLKLTGGLGQLCRLRKINYIRGRARFLDSGRVEVTKSDGGKEDLPFYRAIIATGSVPATLPYVSMSEKVIDSTAALDIGDIPGKLLVVGGGYIGLELGTVYRELGSKVSIVEMTSSLLPMVDKDLTDILKKRLISRFSSIRLNAKIVKVEEKEKALAVTIQEGTGNVVAEDFDKVLVSVGRKPNTEGLGLENTKVKVTSRGFIGVGPGGETLDPNIYAIGDVTGEPMLAHKATHEGRVAAMTIAGKKTDFEPIAIPAVVFTDPDIAWCGLTETEAEEKNIPVKITKYPWTASGRAVTMNRIDGLTKLIIDPMSQRVLGMGITGVGAGELIAEGILAVELGALASDLESCVHPHPTLSETIMGAAENFFGTSTHFYRARSSGSR